MKRLIFIYGLFSFLLLQACTEEIELPNADPRIVVFGIVTNTGMQLSISESVSKTAPNVFPPVEDAEVEITDENGLSTSLTPTPEGIYWSGQPARPGLNYQLEISRRGQEFTASAQMPGEVIQIDSVHHTYLSDADSNRIASRLNIFFRDPPGQPTYGLIRLSSPGLELPDTVITDDGINGAYRDFQMDLPAVIDSGAVLSVEIIHFETTTFGYLVDVNQINAGSGPVGGLTIAPPLNLNGNISGDGLGYFGAATIGMTEIIVE